MKGLYHLFNFYENDLLKFIFSGKFSEKVVETLFDKEKNDIEDINSEDMSTIAQNNTINDFTTNVDKLLDHYEIPRSN